MYEGKIIRFYRKTAKLTQDELGKEICSKSHISKIENGQADYSSEITLLLAKRLGINMTDEITRYKNIERLLHRWNESMISKRIQEVGSIKEKLSDEKLIDIREYKIHYELLKARYYLTLGKMTEAHKIIGNIQKKTMELSPYESNLLKHILGMYYLNLTDYKSAVNTLRTINIRDYNNPEYYYHLAIAYRRINAYSKAYYFAERSLEFFTKTNRFLKVIDAETLLLSLRGSIKDDDFEDTIRKYESLIQSCDVCNDKEGKIILMYNLAYEYFKRKEYDTAGTLFKQLLTLKDSNYHLDSLNFYILSSIKTEILPKDKLVELALSGLTFAKENNHLLHLRIFTLLKYSVTGQDSKYYHYLETNAIPYFRKNGYIKEVAQQYEEELLGYYLQTQQTDKALETALFLLGFEKNAYPVTE